MQFFSKRKPKSNWSKINKEKAANLISSFNDRSRLGCIETAKQNGHLTILDEVEELIIPEDLEIAFEKYKGSNDHFLSLSK